MIASGFRRDVSGTAVAALFTSLKATHCVSSMNESTPMAPMSSVRCKSIIGYLWLSVNANRAARGLLRLHARDGSGLNVAVRDNYLS